MFPNPSTFNIVNKVHHARKRRILAQALSDNSVKAMENHVLTNVKILCDRLKAECRLANTGQLKEKGPQWSEPQDMETLTGYLSFDVMFNICFSKDFNMLTAPDNRYVLEVLGAGVHSLTAVRQIYTPTLMARAYRLSSISLLTCLPSLNCVFTSSFLARI